MKLKSSKFKVLGFWGQWRYHDKIQITNSSCHESQSWKAVGSDNPPSIIPVLWDIGILFNKQVTQTKHFDDQWSFDFNIDFN